MNGGYAVSTHRPGAPLAIASYPRPARSAEFVSGRSRPGTPGREQSSSEAGAWIRGDPQRPKNAGEAAPWYLINRVMRFMYAAVHGAQATADRGAASGYRVAFSSAART